MPPRIKQTINKLIASNHFVMFEFTAGLCYLLKDHYKYLDPEDAERILIGKCEMPKLKGLRDSNRKRNSKIIYLTKPL